MVKVKQIDDYKFEVEITCGSISSLLICSDWLDTTVEQLLRAVILTGIAVLNKFQTEDQSTDEDQT